MDVDDDDDGDDDDDFVFRRVDADADGDDDDGELKASGLRPSDRAYEDMQSCGQINLGQCVISG